MCQLAESHIIAAAYRHILQHRAISVLAHAAVLSTLMLCLFFLPSHEPANYWLLEIGPWAAISFPTSVYLHWKFGYDYTRFRMNNGTYGMEEYEHLKLAEALLRVTMSRYR